VAADAVTWTGMVVVAMADLAQLPQ
jgi:hypothetical protein